MTIVVLNREITGDLLGPVWGIIFKCGAHADTMRNMGSNRIWIWLYINIGVNVHTPLQDPVVKQGEEHAAPKADASMFMYDFNRKMRPNSALSNTGVTWTIKSDGFF
jgi:hypothetical protein